MEPASKLRSIELLEQYFGIKHRRQNYYDSAKDWLSLKSKVESTAVNFAKRHYAFCYDILFYPKLRNRLICNFSLILKPNTGIGLSVFYFKKTLMLRIRKKEA